MGLALIKCQAVEQPAQLTPGNGFNSSIILVWPLKFTFLQPAVIKPEPVVVPFK